MSRTGAVALIHLLTTALIDPQPDEIAVTMEASEYGWSSDTSDTSSLKSLRVDGVDGNSVALLTTIERDAT